MNKSAPKKKIQVRLELDPESNQWIASVDEPKPLVNKGLHYAAGTDPGQARTRLLNVIEEHYPDVFDFENNLISPPGLEQLFNEYKTKVAEEKRLKEWLRENRMPLANALLQQRVPQNIMAEVLGVTPTWLGQELKAYSQRTTGQTGKVIARLTSKTPTKAQR
jgi:hypothetical protein